MVASDRLNLSSSFVLAAQLRRQLVYLALKYGLLFFRSGRLSLRGCGLFTLPFELVVFRR